MRNERDVDVLFAMADLAFSENRIEEAKGLLEEILMIDPTYGRAFNHLGWFYIAHVDDASRAEEFFNLAMKYSPDYAAGYINMARLYVQTRRFDAAISILNRALEVPGAEHATIYEVLGGAYERKGEYREAYRCMKRAFTEAATTPYTEYLKGEMKRVKERLRPFTIVTMFL